MTTAVSPIRILIVDDSALTRRVIRELLSSDPLLQVVGEARDGREAIELAARLQPNIITMDVHMPHMDGLQATEEIMAYYPTPILVLTSAVSGENGALSFQLLNAGALEVLEKPKNLADAHKPEIRRHLIQRIKMLARVQVVTHLRGRRRSRVPVDLPAPKIPKRVSDHQLIILGASTGGPRVLYRLLRDLPAEFPASVLIVQHIAEGFVATMVDWLRSCSALPIDLVTESMDVEPGHVYVAPDTHHTRITDCWTLSLDTEPRSLQYPSIDVTMLSAAQFCPKHTIGVILTGMGRDGADGLLALRKAGAMTLVQDQPSSTIWGMPRAAAENGAAREVVRADDLALRLLALVQRAPQ